MAEDFILNHFDFLNKNQRLLHHPAYSIAIHHLAISAHYTHPAPQLLRAQQIFESVLTRAAHELYPMAVAGKRIRGVLGAVGFGTLYRRHFYDKLAGVYAISQRNDLRFFQWIAFSRFG